MKSPRHPNAFGIAHNYRHIPRPKAHQHVNVTVTKAASTQTPTTSWWLQPTREAFYAAAAARDAAMKHTSWEWKRTVLKGLIMLGQKHDPWT